MKKLLFLLAFAFILSLGFVSSQQIYNLSTNASFVPSANNVANTVEGVVYKALINQFLISITKNATSQGQTCMLINNATGVILSQQTFVNNICGINRILSAGTAYRIGVNYTFALPDTSGSASAPIEYMWGNFTEGCFGGACTSGGGGTFYNIQHITISNDTTPIEIALFSPNNTLGQITSQINFTANITSPSGTLKNATLMIWMNNGLIHVYNNVSLNGTYNSTTIGANLTTAGHYAWNVWACNLNGTCGMDGGNRSLIYGIITNTNTYNSSSFETALEGFTANITLGSGLSISSALLYYNTTSYTGSSSSLGGSDYQLFRAIDLPSINGTISWFWSLLLGSGENINLTSNYQDNSRINLTICGSSPQNILFLNFTFRNETSAQERVNATIPSSSWSYWLGSGSVNKTFTYTSASELKEYSWCFRPPSRTVKTAYSLTYDNLESEQRVYSPAYATSYTNSSTSKELFLLPSGLGQFVTFQVINTAEQALSGVSVTVSRTSIGTIETGVTDSAGSITFFLNPNFAYNFVFSKSGFPDFETTITPTQTSYTVTMGGSTSTNSTNSAAGMSFVILPSQKTLNNGTTYNFNLTLNSTLWALDSWGFTLQNRSGFVFDSESSTVSSGGFLSANLNTGGNKTILMNYFWVINGTYNNATVIWGVLDLTGNTLSIYQFFQDITSYVGLGFFGLDDVGLGLITFFAIFLITGIMSYKFGVNSPAAIMAFIFSLTMFFDIGLGLVPNPIGAIPHAPTFFMGIIMVALIFREMGR